MPTGQAVPENLLLGSGDDLHGNQHIESVIHPPPDVLLVILSSSGRPCTQLEMSNIFTAPGMHNTHAEICSHATVSSRHVECNRSSMSHCQVQCQTSAVQWQLLHAQRCLACYVLVRYCDFSGNLQCWSSAGGAILVRTGAAVQPHKQA